MRGWMKDERQMICCCSDGTRPVIFKIDRLDYQRVSIKGMGCENCEKKIRAAFEALPGMKEVTASHETGVAEVFLEAGVPEKTKGMYEKALSGIEGYEVTGVEYRYDSYNFGDDFTIRKFAFPVY